MFKMIIITVFMIAVFFGYRWYLGKNAPSLVDVSQVNKEEAVAYFAGGCFWCVESDYEKLSEIGDVVSGYMGGIEESPSYNDVASGNTGHREAVKVVYNPNEITYRELVFQLLSHTDPTDAGGSFFDRGHQYTSAIYYGSDKEKNIAKSVIKELDKSGVFGVPIATSVEPAGKFWVAEKYHQDYYKTNSLQYKYYRSGSGRDKFIEKVWGSGESKSYVTINNENSDYTKEDRWANYQKPNKKTLKNILTPLQYYVTQEEGTERPFENEYWDNHEEGIYVDVVSGEPLFSSTDKFDSGTGWPSFLKPLDKSFVIEKKDYKLILPRIEIRSKYSDSHLGHIIMDGPASNDYVRYCMNSASMRFVSKIELGKEGLGEYLGLFN